MAFLSPDTTLFTISSHIGGIPDIDSNNKFLVREGEDEERDEREEDDETSGDESDKADEERHRGETPLVTNPTIKWYAFNLNDVHPHSQSGWVFGRRGPSCDFVLSQSKKSGVSGKHFSIEVDKHARALVLRNLSGRNLWSGRGNDMQIVTSPVVIAESDSIKAGLVTINVDIPIRDRAAQSKFDKMLDAFLANIDEVPDLDIDIYGFRSSSITPHLARGRNSDYFLTNKIVGSGTFGDVRQAYAPTSKTGVNFFAVKQFKNEDSTEQAEKEIKILMKLSHNHIVRYSDVIETDGFPSLVMEYMPCGDLGNYWKCTSPTEYDVAIMLHQMLQALSYSHERDITHRDIKPANVLIQKFTPLITKLADFGLSSEHFLSKTYCGAPLYMAPEGFEAKDNKKCGPPYKWYDSAVDIWSLGMMGLQYTFRLPQYPANLENLQRFFRDVIAQVGRYEGPLAEILQTMLVLDPQERFSAKQTLLALETKLPTIGQDDPGPQIFEIGEEECSTFRQSKRLFGEISAS